MKLEKEIKEELKLVKGMNRKSGKFFYVVYDKNDNWICKIYWDKKKWVVDPKNSVMAGVE